MKLQQVAPSLLESSGLPPDVDERTGLSRTDPESNINMLLDDIDELLGSFERILPEMITHKDRWGVQGNLQEIKSKLTALYNFTAGTER